MSVPDVGCRYGHRGLLTRGDMLTTSEATRQIVEFEELVSRLDRINDHRTVGTSSSSSLPSTVGSARHPETAATELLNDNSVTAQSYTTDINTNDNPPASANIEDSRRNSQHSSNVKTTDTDVSLFSDLRLQVESNQDQEHSVNSADGRYSSYSKNSSNRSLSSHYLTTGNGRSSSFPINGSNYNRLTTRSWQQHQEHLLVRENPREKRVRVNIGIDEDLRMILEMDPSIVDRRPPSPPIFPPQQPPPPPPPLPSRSSFVVDTNSSPSGSSVTVNASSPGKDDYMRTQGNEKSALSTTISASSIVVGRPPRAARPQGWYWTLRD